MNKDPSTSAKAAGASTSSDMKSLDFYIPRLYNSGCYQTKSEDDANDKVEIHRLTLCAKFCALDENRGLLALGDEYGQVVVQNLNDPDLESSMLCEFTGDSFSINDVAWMNSRYGDYLTLVLGGGSGYLKNWMVSPKEKTAKKNTLFTLGGDGNSGPVTCLATNTHLCPGYIAAGFEFGSISFWDNDELYETTRIIHRAHPRTSAKQLHGSDTDEAITALILKSPDTLISAGKGDKFVQVWDMKPKNIKAPVKTFPVKSTVTSMAMLPDDNLLYVNCMDSMIYCFDTNSKFKCSEPLYHFVGHKVASLYVKLSVSPCGGYLASGSSDGFAYIWSTNPSIAGTKAIKQTTAASGTADKTQTLQFTALAKLHGHTKEVTVVDWSWDANDIMLMTASDDSSHRVWKVGAEVPGNEEGAAYVEILDENFGARLAKFPLMSAKAKKPIKAKQSKPSVYKASGKVKKPAKPMRRRGHNCPLQ